MKAIIIRRAIHFLLVLAILLPLRPVTSAQLAAQDDPVVRLQVLRSDEHGLLLELVTGAYTIQPVDRDGVDYDALLLDGASLTSQPGAPQLPQVSALIGVPPEAGLRLNILAEDLQPVPGSYRLLPAPAPAPLDGDLAPGRLAYQEDALAYASLQPYPGNADRLVEDG